MLTVGADTGWVPEEALNEQPPSQPTPTAAAAGDRWAPDPDTDDSSHHAADLHTGYKRHGDHKDQRQKLGQKTPESPNSKAGSAKHREGSVKIVEDQRHSQKPGNVLPTIRDISMRLEPASGPPATGRFGELGLQSAAAAAAATGISSQVRSAAPQRGHTRSRSPSAAATEAARRDINSCQQQQQRSADPPLWSSDVLAGMMARQDLSGIRNDERDELRSLALLHMVGGARGRGGGVVRPGDFHMLLVGL